MKPNESETIDIHLSIPIKTNQIKIKIKLDAKTKNRIMLFKNVSIHYPNLIYRLE